MTFETNWRDYLKPAEIERLAEIDAVKKAGQVEQRRIYDRCRQRLLRAKVANHAGKFANQEAKNG